MYTNEVLEEKYKAQRELYEKAKKLSKDYLYIVEEEVKELFKKMGWTLRFSKRRGEWLVPKSIKENKH